MVLLSQWTLCPMDIRNELARVCVSGAYLDLVHFGTPDSLRLGVEVPWRSSPRHSENNQDVATKIFLWASIHVLHKDYF